MKEIEKKFRVSDLEKYKRIMEESGGIFHSHEVEVDTYFNVSGRDSMATKECLRTRRRGDAFYELTYKPGTRREELDALHFSKIETNVQLNPTNEIESFLELIGNSKLVSLKKDRTVYSYKGVTVCLDIINGVHCCVEIEVDGEVLSEDGALRALGVVAEDFGLIDGDIERRPYRDIAMGL